MITSSNTLRMRDEPAIALYEDGSQGSFRGDFRRGKNEQARRLGVTVP